MGETLVLIFAVAALFPLILAATSGRLGTVLGVLAVLAGSVLLGPFAWVGYVLAVVLALAARRRRHLDRQHQELLRELQRRP